MNNYVDRLILALWPMRCVMCEQPQHAQQIPALGLCSAVSACDADICDNCIADLPLLISYCDGCGLPITEMVQPERNFVLASSALDALVTRLCGACLSKPMFDRCVVSCEYAWPINLLVQSLKYSRRRVMARVLARVFSLHLEQQAKQCRLVLPDVIVPVPLSPWRLVSRSYNQAAEIAACLPEELGKRVDAGLVRRIKATQPQTGLSKAARARNLSQAFMLKRDATAAIQGRNIAVLDDVITSGATMIALASLLREAGAASVQVWAIARRLK
ncbi:MAG: ComF family protein [Gammaproteobacteria bacterium]|nr:ComF family protein [Gammaproteobacteria bacterium]